MQIYFIRHGQTDWNVEKRLQGQLDTPINATGEQQAAQNGKKLKSLIPDPENWHFVASPLIRTRKTMELIRTNMGLSSDGYATDDRLKEVHFGDWQNKTWDEVRQETPGAVEQREDNKWHTVAPGHGGESYAMLYDRIVDWLNSLKGNTVCVSHGGINRCLQKHFLQLPEKDTNRIIVPQDQIMSIKNNEIEWL